MPDLRFSTRALLWVVALIVLLGIAVVLLSEEADAVKSISLSIQGSDTQSVQPGGSATFKINITNTLTTTQLTVNLTNSTPPTHWTAQLSQSQITVNALATKSVTLTVGVPSNATADSVGKQVIVTADPDFGDTEQITTTTKVSQTFGIQTSSATTLKSTVGGSAVTFSMQINNTGNGQDTVNVSHSGEPSSWTVSHVSSVTVPAGGSRSVTVTVVPPSSANAGTYQTTVKATSSDGSTNDQTTFLVIISKQYALTLSSSDVSKYVTPNVATYYNMSVTNAGNTADSAQISIVNPPTGWTVLPTSNPVSLNPNETKDFKILVTAPNTVLAGTQVQVTINATSNGNTSIVRQLSINAVVNQVYDPRVTPQTNNKVVAPGDSVTFKINVSNQGNGNDTVDLGLTGVPSGQGWVYNFNPVSVTLTPGQTKTVDLTFTIGSRAAFGDNLVTVIGTSHGTSITGTTTVVVSVSQFYDLALVPVGASTKRVDPGGSVEYNFSLTNTGNGPDDITFTTIGVESSWVHYFSKTTVYNLPANSTETTTLTLEIPSTTNSGTYRFDVKATSGGNTSVSRSVINITVIVNQLFSVELVSSSGYYSGDPGSGVLVNLTVTNDGSGADNFTMSVPGQHSSWVAFNITTVTLGPGASKVVGATVTPPADTSAGDVTITFRATSKGRTSVNDEASVNLTVNEVYGARLTAVEATINRKPTETATFTVQLKNTGNTADTFKVNFTSNPRNLASHSLPSPFVALGQGNTRTFSVTVTVPSGEPVGNLGFSVMATSGNDTAASATIVLTVVVDPVYGVDLFSYDATAEAEPTDSDTVELRVENTGNGQDTYRLRATGPHYKWVSFEASSVTVDAGSEFVVNMTVTLPDTDEVSTGTYHINITATSTSDSSATKTLQVKVTVLHKEDLEITADDLIRRRSTDPGSSVDYQLKVENLGLKAHVVNLDLGGTHAGWAKLNKTLLIVPAGSSKTVRVTVSVPDGTAPMSFQVNVTGTFDDNEARKDTFGVITTVNTVHDVSVELNDTTVAAPPGTAITVTLNVNNTGNSQDTFDIEVDAEEDWFTFTPTYVTLAAGANTNVTVRIVAPDDPLTPAGLYHLNVTAVSRGNSSVSGMEMLELTVEQVYAVKVKATPLRRSVDPGTNARYNVTVSNEGNGEDIFVLSVEGARKAWGRLSPTQVTLAAGEETVVVLTVRIPSNQPVEDAVVMVNATSSGGENITRKVTTTTTINAFFGVDLTISNTLKTAFPGKWVSFKVKVKNTGNSQDTFNFEVTGDNAAWVVTLDPLTIDAGKTKTLDFNVTPPPDIANGLYGFTLNSTSDTQGDAFDLLELEVDINVFHALLLTLSETAVDSRPDATETVQVFVENKGNVNDTYDVRALGPYSSWATIDNVTLDVDEGDTGVATATIQVDANATSGQYVIRFEVTSRAGGNVTEVEFTVSIELSYGLAMRSLRDEVPGAPNTTVRAEVELTNEGNVEDIFDLSITQLPGSLWDAELEVGQLSVAAGGSGFFNVTVDVPEGVKAGTHVVRVRAVSSEAPRPRPSETLLVNITIDFNVSALGPAGTLSVLPDESKTVQVTVKNEGLGRDTILLSVSEPYEDWADLSATSVVLDAGQSVPVDVTVTPPTDALAGTYILKVRAESSGDARVSSLADVKVRVEQVYMVMVEPLSSTVEGVAGSWHTTNLKVSNLGNGEDVITMLAVPPSGSTLEARFDTGSPTLAPGENVSVTLRVRASPSELAGSHVIEVQARSSSTSVQPFKVFVTYTIPAFRSVNVLTSDGLSQLALPDSKVAGTYEKTIEVFNLGNSDDTYELVVTSQDPDLPTWFTFESDEVSIDAGASELLTVTVDLPGTVLADTYQFTIWAKSKTADVNGTLVGSVEVDADRSVVITTDDNSASVDPAGSQSAAFTITVQNNGNVQESVTLSTSLPSGWQPPTVEPSPVTVAPYATATVTLTFPPGVVPANAQPTNSVNVRANYGGMQSPMLNLFVQVLQPDVSVTGISLEPKRPTSGDLVSVKVTLKNSGSVDATGLDIKLLVNEAEAGSLTDRSIAAGQTREFVFDWDVVEDEGSKVTLKVRIPSLDLTHDHPDPVTIESGEKTLTEKILDLPFLTVILLGLIVGLVLGLIVAGGVRSRYKKRLEAARAAGMAEGMTLADMEEAEDEGGEGILEDEEEGAEDEEAEDEEGAEDEEEATPVTVQCPKCETLNKVTTSQRPYEFRCKECDALLRLSR